MFEKTKKTVGYVELLSSRLYYHVGYVYIVASRLLQVGCVYI